MNTEPTGSNRIKGFLNNTFNPIQVFKNTISFGVQAFLMPVKATKYIYSGFENSIKDRSQYFTQFLNGLNQFYKTIFLLCLVLLLSISFIGGSNIANFTLDKIPSGFANKNSRVEQVYVPSKGVGNEDSTNNAKQTLINIIGIIRNALSNSEDFLKAVYSERPLFLENDTFTINGESYNSPKKLLYTSTMGLATSLTLLFLIFDSIKILMGFGGDFKKLLYKYLFGFLILSLSGVFINYTIDFANAITSELLVNNGDPNRSKIGSVLDEYYRNIQQGYRNKKEWKWNGWWTENYVFNPVVLFEDLFDIIVGLIPLLALLAMVLLNGFALLTNWVMMYVLSGLVPLAICFYMVDWNHSIPRNFINSWVQNVLQLPMFSFVFSAFLTFLQGGVGNNSSFKVALFFAFLSVMLNVNQNFGSIFSGFTSQMSGAGSALIGGLAGGATNAVASGTMNALGSNGIARRFAGGLGNQALAFAGGAKTGQGTGIANRMGKSVNSLAKGIAGQRSSSYVMNRIGRGIGSIGIGGKNVTGAVRATGAGLQAVGAKAKATGQAIKGLKTDVSKTTSKLNPLKKPTAPERI